MDQAEVWIGLTDGGNGLEEFVRRNFSRDPMLILDFWHAADHLTELVKMLHPEDEDRRKELLGSWCHTMKHEGRSCIVAVSREFPSPHKKAVQEKHAEVVNYLESNVHSMDYPEYVANG